MPSRDRLLLHLWKETAIELISRNKMTPAWMYLRLSWAFLAKFVNELNAWRASFTTTASVSPSRGTADKKNPSQEVVKVNVKRQFEIPFFFLSDSAEIEMARNSSQRRKFFVWEPRQNCKLMWPVQGDHWRWIMGTSTRNNIFACFW